MVDALALGVSGSDPVEVQILSSAISTWRVYLSKHFLLSDSGLTVLS